MRAQRFLISVCLLALAGARDGWAQQTGERWAEPAASLSRQIAALAGPGPATLTVQNSSSIAADRVPAVRRLLEADLKADGVTVRAAAEGAAIPTAVRVTLSQTAEHGLWVAEVQQGAETKVAMTEVALESAAVVQPAQMMTLRKQMMFHGAEKVLDAESFRVGAGTELVVLTPARILTFTQSDGQWVAGPVFAVEHANAFPRDVRGRLVAEGGAVHAYLPGVVCEGVAAQAGLAFQCGASDDPWPIGTQRAFYVAGRNYFSGVLSPAYGGELPPFYSAAEVARGNGTATVFSGIKGNVRVLDHGTQTEVTGSRDWGSDLAAMKSGCGAGTQVLVDAAGDPAADSLRAYEVRGTEAAAVSQTLGLDGTVTAVQTSSDGAGATVVVRTANQAADGYEVWHVALDCH